MWCFDVDARVERGANVTSSAMKHLSLRAPSDAPPSSARENESGGRFGNEKMTRAAARTDAPGSAYAFWFGDGGKAPHVVSVGAIKAVFGKFVREGKLTIESKDGVKVFISGSPAECARVMKTVTTMKSQPTEARETYLRSLTRCGKCAGKCEAMEKRAEEKRAREARVAEEKAAASAEKKRKRDAVAAERDAAREAKTNEALRDAEEKRSRLERAKGEIASMRIDIEAERESLRREKESIVQRRRELEDERRLLERAEKEIAERRDAVSLAREGLQEETTEINALKAANVKERNELDAEKHRFERMRREVREKREELEAEVERRQYAAEDLKKAEQRVREETARREALRATRRAQQATEMLRPTSPGSFYGKKKAKIVMDDDSDSDADAEDAEENKENTAEDLRRKQRIERLRQAEIERQRREKAAKEEVARTQAEAQRRRDRARAAQLEQKAERERKKRLEEETFTHHRRKAEHEARMRQRSRENTVPTATKVMWESHLASLDNLKTRAEASLGEADFPWPPKHNIAFFSAGDGSSDRKKKVMKATLSWHPDKFEQKYGKLLKPSEAEKIRKRVADLSAQFIEIRHVMNTAAPR
tara:strand:+ start:583 stop:2370 length:1788 start_codon:yes stop_codon:yes gene_type:complete